MYNPSTGNSYSEQHVKKMNMRNATPPKKSFMIDRESYINFLEMQLEKVSTASLTVESFAPKFEQLQNRVESAEESLNSMQASLKLTKQSLDNLRKDDREKITLKQLLQDEDDEEYLAKMINKIISSKLSRYQDAFEKKFKRLQRKLSSQIQASKERKEDPADSDTEQYDADGKKKRRLHHHFHHYPDQVNEQGTGVFSEERMKLIDGFDKLFEEVQEHADTVDRVKKDLAKVKSEVDTDLKKMKREIKHISQSNSKKLNESQENIVNSTAKDIHYLTKRVDTLETQLVTVKDTHESQRETHDTKVLYHLTSIEERMKADSENTLQLVRKIERDVQQKMFDVNNLVKQELEDLQQQTRIIADAQYVPKPATPKNYEKMIDLSVKRRIDDIKTEILDLIGQHHKENQVYIEHLIERRSKIDQMVDIDNTPSRFPNTPNTPIPFKSSVYTTSPLFDNTAGSATNLMNTANSSAISTERRRRLKDLYKELADLEMQEYSAKSK